MKIEIRCYGRVKQALGDRRRTILLPDGATVSELLNELESTNDGFDRQRLSGPAGLIIMRDRVHLADDDQLSDGDRVAISDSPMVEG